MKWFKTLFVLYIIMSAFTFGEGHPATVCQSDKQLPVKVFVNSNSKAYDKQIASYIETRLTERKIKVLSTKELQTLVDEDMKLKSKDLFREENFGNTNGYNVVSKGPKYAEILRVTCVIEKNDSSFSFKKIEYQHYTLPPSQKPGLIGLNLKDYPSREYSAVLDSVVYKAFGKAQD